MECAVNQKMDEIVTESASTLRNLGPDETTECDKDVSVVQVVDKDRNKEETVGEEDVKRNGSDDKIKENDKSEHINTDGYLNRDSGKEEESNIQFVDEKRIPSDNYVKDKDKCDQENKDGELNDIEIDFIDTCYTKSEDKGIRGLDGSNSSSPDIDTNVSSQTVSKFSNVSLDLEEKLNKCSDFNKDDSSSQSVDGITEIGKTCSADTQKSVSGDVLIEEGNANITEGNMTMSVEIITDKGNKNVVDSDIAIQVDVVTEKGNKILGEVDMTKSVDIITEKGSEKYGENTPSSDKTKSVDILTEKDNKDSGDNTSESSKMTMSVDITEKDNTDIVENTSGISDMKKLTDSITEKGNTDCVNIKPGSSDMTMAVDIITEKGNKDFGNNASGCSDMAMSVDIITEKGNTDCVNIKPGSSDMTMAVDIITGKGNTYCVDNTPESSDITISVDIITEKGKNSIRNDISESVKEVGSKVINNVDNEETYDMRQNEETTSIENYLTEPGVIGTESPNVRKSCHKNDKKVSESEVKSKIIKCASEWSNCYVKLNKLNVDNLNISDIISDKPTLSKTVSTGSVNVIYQTGGSASRVTTEVIVDGVIIEETCNIEEIPKKQNGKRKGDSEDSDCKKQKTCIEGSYVQDSDQIRRRSTRATNKTDEEQISGDKKQKHECLDEENSRNLFQELPRTRNKSKGKKQKSDNENLKDDELGTDEFSSCLLKNLPGRTRNKTKEAGKTLDSRNASLVENRTSKTRNKKAVEENFEKSANICVDDNSDSADEELNSSARSKNIRSRSSKQIDYSHNNITNLDEESPEFETEGKNHDKNCKKNVTKVNEKDKKEDLGIHDVTEENMKRKTRQRNVIDNDQNQYQQEKCKGIESQQRKGKSNKETAKVKTSLIDNDEHILGENKESEPQWLTDAVNERRSKKSETTPDDIFDEFYQCIQGNEEQGLNDTSNEGFSKRNTRGKPSTVDKHKCEQESSRQGKSESCSGIDSETSLKIKPCSVEIIRCDVSDKHISCDIIPHKKRKISKKLDLRKRNEVTSLPEVRYSPINVDFDAEELDLIEPVFSGGIDLIGTCLDILDNDLKASMATTSDKCPVSCELKSFCEKYHDAKLSNCTIQLVRIDQSKSSPEKFGNYQNNSKSRKTDTTKTNEIYDASETRKTRSAKPKVNSKQSEDCDIDSGKRNEEMMSDSSSNEELVEQYCTTRLTRLKNSHKVMETKQGFGKRLIHIDSNKTSKKEKTETDMEIDIQETRTTRGKRQQNTIQEGDRKPGLFKKNSDSDYSEIKIGTTSSKLSLEENLSRQPQITREKRQRNNSYSLNKKQNKAMTDKETENEDMKTAEKNNFNKHAKLDSQSEKMCRKLSVRLERCRNHSGKSYDNDVLNSGSERPTSDALQENDFDEKRNHSGKSYDNDVRNSGSERPTCHALQENDFDERRNRKWSNNSSINKSKVCSSEFSEIESVRRSKRSRHNSHKTSDKSELNQSNDQVSVKKTRRCRNDSREKSDPSDVSRIEHSEINELYKNNVGRATRSRNNSKISNRNSKDISDSHDKKEVSIVLEKSGTKEISDYGIKSEANCFVKLERLNISKDLHLLQHQNFNIEEKFSDDSNINDKLESQNCDCETNTSEVLEKPETSNGNKNIKSGLPLGQNCDSLVPEYDIFCKPDEINENVLSEMQEKNETSQDENSHIVEISLTNNNRDTECDSNTEIFTGPSSDEQIDMTNKNSKVKEYDGNIEIFTDSSSDIQIDITEKINKAKECDSSIEIFTEPSTDDENNAPSQNDSYTDIFLTSDDDVDISTE